eukprot:494862_1
MSGGLTHNQIISSAMQCVDNDTKTNQKMTVNPTDCNEQCMPVTVPVTMSNVIQSISNRKCIFNWKHICNAICHELYVEISLAFMRMVTTSTQYTTVDELLNNLQQKTEIRVNEIRYIKQLIQRAITFYYPPKKKAVEDKILNQHYRKKSLFKVGNKEWISYFENDVLDIYNVHNAFIFMNFNFEQYELADNMEEKNTFEIIKFDLFPSYIIDD